MPRWEGWRGGCWTGGVLLPVPQAPAWLKDPGLLPAEGGLDLYWAFCLSPAGEVPGAWHSQPGLCQLLLRNDRDVCCELGGPGPGTAPSQSCQELTRLHSGQVSAVLLWSSAARPILPASLLLRGA